MSGLEDPSRFQSQAMIVRSIELIAPIRHVGHLPATHAIVHANLRFPCTTPLTPAGAGTYDANRFS